MQMALSCDDVNARLVDLVYGEGSASERQVLEAHVGGCTRCQADLDTLGRTRAAVRGRLDEAPPPRVRARILQAAAEAVARPQKVQPALAAKSPTEPTFWDRLRLRWTLPTLATVGAFAVILLSARVLLNPGSAYKRGRDEMAREATPEQTAAPVAEPTPPAAPPANKRLARRYFAAPPVAAEEQAAPTEGEAPAPGASALRERALRLHRAPRGLPNPFLKGGPALGAPSGIAAPFRSTGPK